MESWFKSSDILRSHCGWRPELDQLDEGLIDTKVIPFTIKGTVMRIRASDLIPS